MRAFSGPYIELAIYLRGVLVLFFDYAASSPQLLNGLLQQRNRSRRTSCSETWRRSQMIAPYNIVTKLCISSFL